jgi:hypothetical protein
MTSWLDCLARCTLPLALVVAVSATGCGTDTSGDGLAVDTGAARSKPKPPKPSGTPAPGPSAGTGSLAWQVRLDGPYSMVRPALGPDGTVYAIDVNSNLYAVAPDGTLRWKKAGAGNKGLAVGGDGTVYVGSESAVRAFGPDGALRWQYVESPRAFILLGIAVGPDGNVYGVATEGLGVFSLTPGGALRWKMPEGYFRPNVSYGEIVFGPGPAGPQLYFYANHHVRAVRLDGRSAWEIGYGNQPAVSPYDGSVHVGDTAFRAGDGSILWQVGISSGATPVIDARGTSYFSFLQSSVYAVDASGRTLWTRSSSDWLDEATLDPAGKTIVFTATDATTGGGVLDAFSTSGTLLWRLAFPGLGGGTQYADTRLRFTPDGAAAYLVTASSATGFSYLTAIGL